MPSKWLSCAVLLSVLPLGCRSKSSLPPNFGPSDILPPASDAQPVAPATDLEAQLTLPKTRFARGEIVPLVVTLRNNSKQAQTLRFTSGQRFDFWLTRQGQKAIVWRWSKGKMFTQNLRAQTLEAGQSLSFQDTWNQADNAGEIVPRGAYLLHGIVTANKGIEAAPVTIELTDEPQA